MVRVHSGLLAQVRKSAKRRGLNSRDCEFESHPEHIRRRLGRQLADHSRLEREMLWVRIPLELLQVRNENTVLVEQRSARLFVKQEITGSNPVGDANWHGALTGKAAKLKPS